MLELKKIGLTEMSLEESNEFEGGSFWKDLGYGIGYCSNQVYGAFISIANRPQDDVHSWIHK
jgi:hypothetical protein